MTDKAVLPRTRSALTLNYRIMLVAILLVAAVLRIHGLNNVSPPGLEHDEVAHWIINRDILAGNHGIYFTEAYGHEAGFHYVQTGFMTLMGDNAFVLRLPSAFAGLLLVAVSFALTRRLFGVRYALLAAGLMAVLFWPVFYSRLALRAISLPLVSGLSAYFWWRGWFTYHNEGSERSKRCNGRQRSLLWFAIAGLLAGLALYTYMASRAVPIFYLLFATYLLIFHQKAFGQQRAGILLFFGLLVLVAAPLLIYLAGNAGVESRIGEVDAPLRSLLDGNLWPVLENSLKIMAMFALRGDPLWRQNVAHLPIFDIVVGLFFVVGLAISLWRWRQARYTFLILWLFSSAIPSIVTIDAPSSIRMVNALPILGVFPVIGLEVIHLFTPLSTVFGRLSPVFQRNIVIVGLILLFILNVGRTWRAIFDTWPSNDEVQFVWQQALTEIAIYLDHSPEVNAVAIGGWTPGTMDPPTMELTLRREDLEFRYFDPGRALIIPEGGLIAFPTALPLHHTLAETLANLGVFPQSMGSFTLLNGKEIFSEYSDAKALVTFGNEVSLIDYRVNTGPDAMEFEAIWRVEKPPASERRIFMHLVSDSGDIVAQDDALGAPAEFWQSGDIIIQQHTVALPALAELPGIRLGIYSPQTGQRLVTNSDSDSYCILLP